MDAIGRSRASGRPSARSSSSASTLDKFPGWSRVEVTTGWLTARVDGQALVADARIQTDPERFWDYYQAKVLPRVYDNVMKVTGGKPTADKQPFLPRLRHRGLDERARLAHRRRRGAGVVARGAARGPLLRDARLLRGDGPHADEEPAERAREDLPDRPSRRPGKPGQARILYAGNAATKAKIDITYKEKGVEKPTIVSRDLGAHRHDGAAVVRAVVRDDRVSEFELQVEAKDDKEAARAVDALDGLARLQAAGLYKTALSYEHVDRVAVSVRAEGRADAPGASRGRATSMPSNVRVAAERRGTADAGERRGPAAACAIVTWDHVIGPDESEQIVAKLGGLPGGPQLQGRPVVPRPRHLGDGGHAAHAERAGVGRRSYTAFKPTHPHAWAASTRTRSRPPATSCGSANCSRPTRLTRRSSRR